MRVVYRPFVSFEMPLPWDVLHAASIKYLPGRARGWVDFDPPEILAPGLSVFTLTQYELGNLGRIVLRKLGDKMTFVDVECPAWSNPDQLDGRRKKHLEDVLQSYLCGLVRDVSIWEANSTFPPLYILAWAGIKSAEDGFRESRYFGDFIKAAFNKAQAVSGDAGGGQAQPTGLQRETVGGVKDKGRYRLTDDEIKSRRKRVREAKKRKKESPQMLWKQIAKDLDLPERTLRDWRHNPLYD